MLAFLGDDEAITIIHVTITAGWVEKNDLKCWEKLAFLGLFLFTSHYVNTIHKGEIGWIR